MTLRSPPLDSLRFLEASVRLRSFSAAAQELHVTPAAVSLRMRNLEADLGTPLFRRSGPRVEPTEAAHKLSESVARGLDVMRAALEEVSRKTASLRVTCVPTFGARWLAPRLPKYHRRSGAVRIELDLSAELRRDEQFDVAVRTGNAQWPEFHADVLAPVDATPMLSPALAKTLELRNPGDLTKLPLLPHDDWTRWLDESGAEIISSRFYVDEYSTHDLDATAAIEGVGVALLSPWLFRFYLDEGKLIQPFAHTISGPNSHFILTRHRERRRTVLDFCDWLKEEMCSRHN